MRIRKDYPIWDRVKLLIILIILLVIMIVIAGLKTNQRKHTEANVTMEHLLKTAMKPVGSTMYIWGGGWDSEDTEAGAGSTQIGLSPKWAEFAKLQDETYDYEEHRYERENGLDCSGYVGWVVYNTFETESGQAGYVTLSTDMAENFASRGWGELIENPEEFLPGDIVSMVGHVWISLGTCEDGSVLFVHSSPPGVSVCGTQTPDGESSIAIELATEYMTEYHAEWQEKYPDRSVSAEYLTGVTVMRWNTTTLPDAKEYQKMNGEEILNGIKRIGDGKLSILTNTGENSIVHSKM